MARAPITQTTRELLTPRERIWRAARSLRTFTLNELDQATAPPVGRAGLESYVQALVHGGYLKHLKPLGRQRPDTAKFLSPEFVLLRDCGVNAPRLTRSGKPAKYDAVGAMWAAMRTLKQFNYKDIALAASTTEQQVNLQTAKSYVNLLAKANYFRQVKAPALGQHAQPAVYALLRNTGPKAPAITRVKAVFDRNEGQLIVVADAQEVADGLE